MNEYIAPLQGIYSCFYLSSSASCSLNLPYSATADSLLTSIFVMCLNHMNQVCQKPLVCNTPYQLRSKSYLRGQIFWSATEGFGAGTKVHLLLA